MTKEVEIKVSDRFTKQRIKEVKDSHEQQTFGTAEIEALEPVLKEIIGGNPNGVVVACESGHGTMFVYKYHPSTNLLLRIMEARV